MGYFLVFIGELICLFILSRMLTQLLSIVLLHVTKNDSFTIHLLSLLFLPGVIVHELSHMFMASILFVPVGEIEFWPQIHGNTVKLGSVRVAKTDPLRRFMIGAAPLIGGIGILLVLYLSLSSSFASVFSWQSLVFLYALFEVGNTMFSSKKDMEGAIALFMGVGVFLLLLFLIGFRLQLTAVIHLFSPPVSAFFEKVDIIIAIPIVINTILCVSMRYGLLKKRITIGSR